ncbi:MAG: hypothetical protein IPL49_17885 [Saprospirales bacterium]|nr:hypothetical protein [Saprospirales bacterium]
MLNILPEETARELKNNGFAKARFFDAVTVMFIDFEGFTRVAEELPPEELVGEIDFCFRAYDEIMEKYGLEKIKTVGMPTCALGLARRRGQIGRTDRTSSPGDPGVYGQSKRGALYESFAFLPQPHWHPHGIYRGGYCGD